MLYRMYEARRAMTSQIFGVADVQSAMLRGLPGGFSEVPPVRVWRAMAETTAALELTHRRPAFGIESVLIDGEVVSVREEVADHTPFGTLVRFAKDGADTQPP